VKKAELKGVTVSYLPESNIESDTLPAYRINNLDLAKFVASKIGLSESTIKKGEELSRWPGRLEEFEIEAAGVKKRILIDGAHNPDGVRGLAEYLTKSRAKEFIVLISILEIKDSLSMMREFQKWKEGEKRKIRFFFCRMNYYGSSDPEKLAGHIGEGEVFNDATSAIDALKKELHPDALGVVTGSLYFIAEAREILGGGEVRTFSSE